MWKVVYPEEYFELSKIHGLNDISEELIDKLNNFSINKGYILGGSKEFNNYFTSPKKRNNENNFFGITYFGEISMDNMIYYGHFINKTNYKDLKDIRFVISSINNSIFNKIWCAEISMMGKEICARLEYKTSGNCEHFAYYFTTNFENLSNLLETFIKGDLYEDISENYLKPFMEIQEKYKLNETKKL